MLPQKIILSGGGIRGIAHIGALIELRKYGYLKLVKEWLGVSAGSILALMIVIGYTLEELLTFSMNFDFSNIMDPDDPTAWIFKFGIFYPANNKTVEKNIWNTYECLKLANNDLTDLKQLSNLNLNILGTKHYLNTFCFIN